MPKKETLNKDVEIIIQYAEKTEEKSLQHLIQKLFDDYMARAIQNINKGK